MTMLCNCGGSNGPLLMFHAVSRFRRLLLVVKFLSSGPSSRGELLAYAARELSTVYSCPSSCGNVSVGNEEQSCWSLNTLISFVLGFSAGSTLIGVTVLCRRRHTHGLASQGEVVDDWWTDLLPADYLDVDYVDGEVSHERIAMWPLSDRNATWVGRSPDGDEWLEDLSCVDLNFGPSRTLPFARVGLRPRGRRRLYAFRARLVDEALRTAILRARDQVIHMGGDGAYRPCTLSGRMALSGPCKSSFPNCSKGLPPTGYAMERGWLQDLEPVGMLLRRVLV